MSQTIFVRGGYLMRSHSETRWADMMDALNIGWLYEPRLVKTRHGAYLPDFYLPRAGMALNEGTTQYQRESTFITGRGA